jgi:hypothetical protein
MHSGTKPAKSAASKRVASVDKAKKGSDPKKVARKLKAKKQAPKATYKNVF